jgi:hypothetical protein
MEGGGGREEGAGQTELLSLKKTSTSLVRSSLQRLQVACNVRVGCEVVATDAQRCWAGVKSFYCYTHAERSL